MIYDPFNRDIKVVKGDSLTCAFEFFDNETEKPLGPDVISSAKIVCADLSLDSLLVYDSNSNRWYPNISEGVTDGWAAGNYKYDIQIVYKSPVGVARYTPICEAGFEVIDSEN
jgi:hypothetical protein